MTAENRAIKTRLNELATFQVSRIHMPIYLYSLSNTNLNNNIYIYQTSDEGVAMSEAHGRVDIKGGTVEKLIERLYNQDQLSGINKIDNS